MGAHGSPTAPSPYAAAWLVSGAGLALLGLWLFGTGGAWPDRGFVQTVLILAGVTAGIALWAAARFGTPIALRGTSYGQRMLLLFFMHLFLVVPLGMLDGCALLVVGLGRIH